MRIRFPVLLPLLVLAACAGPAAPPDNFYRVEPAAPVARLAAPILPGLLEVERLAADGALAERAVAFMAQEGGPLAHYKYDYWSEAPAVLLQERLARFLTQAGVADRVVTPDLRTLPDWSLRGKVLRFEQVADRSLAAVHLRLGVVSSRDGRLLLLEDYAIQVPTRSDQVQTLAAAMEQGVATLFQRFLADLERARPLAAKAQP